MDGAAAAARGVTAGGGVAASSDIASSPCAHGSAEQTTRLAWALQAQCLGRRTAAAYGTSGLTIRQALGTWPPGRQGKTHGRHRRAAYQPYTGTALIVVADSTRGS
jgi:hypothetical protein